MSKIPTCPRCDSPTIKKGKRLTVSKGSLQQYMCTKCGHIFVPVVIEGQVKIGEE